MSDVTTKGEFVFFWGGWPSQWFKSEFEINGKTFNCCEQFMMAEKARVFEDPEAETKIMATNNPRTQKSWGRKVKHFDAEVWNSVCRGIVYQANLAKFSQNEGLEKLLLQTEHRTIVEASPKDRIWGIGLSDSNPDAMHPEKWRGKNWLGIALMQVRDELNRRAGAEIEMDSELKLQLERRAEIAQALR